MIIKKGRVALDVADDSPHHQRCAASPMVCDSGAYKITRLTYNNYLILMNSLNPYRKNGGVLIAFFPRKMMIF